MDMNQPQSSNGGAAGALFYQRGPGVLGMMSDE